jgi:hypothetical protein
LLTVGNITVRALAAAASRTPAPSISPLAEAIEAMRKGCAMWRSANYIEHDALVQRLGAVRVAMGG